MNRSGTAAIDRLAAYCGVIDVWHDFDGREHRLSAGSKRALLAGMGVSVADDAEAGELLASRQAEDASRLTSGEIIIAARTPHSVTFGGKAEWRLTGEGGQLAGEGTGDGVIDLPALEGGIYLLESSWPGGGEEATVIAAPARAPSLRDITGQDRIWGVTAAIYGLRSQRNSGIGDFSDLAAAAEALAGQGAAFLGINPVHAIGFADRKTVSPYSPASRSFHDIRHIAFDAIPGFSDLASVHNFFAGNAETLQRLRAATLVDYDAVRSIQDFLFARLYGAFSQTAEMAGSNDAFEKWLAIGGDSLRLFAIYEALSEKYGPDWRKWPAGLQSPAAPRVEAFAVEFSKRIRFHCWLQWIATKQIAAAHERAKAAGMQLGLYLDIAVGSRMGGAESWMRHDAIAAGISLGAPPDAFSPDGQNWELAPFSPEGLRRSRYAPFVHMLRAAMRHAGMVRIDHALGLARSFWIPESGEPGGYVRYPLEALLAIIAIEAQRSATLVIGEDLGLVPRGFRERLEAAGLYGCEVMQFEREDDGKFRDPRSWRQAALASFGTHDTPTYAGFLAARDAEWRARLGGAPSDLTAISTGRKDALACLFDVMGIDCGDGLAAGSLPDPCPVHEALAKSGSSLVAVQLDDVLGAAEQQNLPGTIDEHPNWRRRYGVCADRFEAEASLAETAAVMQRERPLLKPA